MALTTSIIHDFTGPNVMYAAHQDGACIGHYPTYADADAAFSQPPYAALSMSADPEPDPPPPVPPGQGGDDPERGPYAEEGDTRVAECAMCYHVGPCAFDGEAWVCVDEPLCAERQCAAFDVAAYEAACSVPHTPASPLLARQDAPGYYYVSARHFVMFHHPTRRGMFLQGFYDAERARRVAARLNAMRCREVAS